MTVFPYQINEVAQLYNRISRFKTSSPPPEKDLHEPQDIVNISAEAKKMQIHAEINKNKLERIKILNK